MSFWTLNLNTVQVDKIDFSNNQLSIDFHGELFKTMEGASERTCWKQHGSLRLNTTTPGLVMPETLPAALRGGELTDNIYVFRNSIRVPLKSVGNIALQLDWKDSDIPLVAEGDAIEIELHKTPTYIRHVR